MRNKALAMISIAGGLLIGSIVGSVLTEKVVKPLDKKINGKRRAKAPKAETPAAEAKVDPETGLTEDETKSYMINDDDETSSFADYYDVDSMYDPD